MFLYGVEILLIFPDVHPIRHLPAQSIFIVNFEHISHLVLMFLLLTLNM